MNKAQFDYLCSTYGDSSLKDSEKWKSVCYIATTTTKVPTFSVQHLLRTDQIRFSESIGEPGFFITDYQSAQSGIVNNKFGLVTTFIPLALITSITVTSKTIFNNGKEPSPEPDIPDAVIDALTSEMTEINVIDVGENSSSDEVEYTVIYDGCGANVIDDTNN